MSLCTNVISIISYDFVEKYDILHYFCEINFRPVQVHTLRTEARTEIYKEWCEKLESGIDIFIRVFLYSVELVLLLPSEQHTLMLIHTNTLKSPLHHYFGLLCSCLPHWIRDALKLKERYVQSSTQSDRHPHKYNAITAKNDSNDVPI